MTLIQIDKDIKMRVDKKKPRVDKKKPKVVRVDKKKPIKIKNIDKKKPTDEKNIDKKKVIKELHKNKKFVVLFRANWCGHCKAITKEWESAVNAYEKKNKSKLLIIEIEHDGFDSIKDIEPLNHVIEKVSGIPTLFFVDFNKTDAFYHKFPGNLTDDTKNKVSTFFQDASDYRKK